MLFADATPALKGEFLQKLLRLYSSITKLEMTVPIDWCVFQLQWNVTVE